MSTTSHVVISWSGGVIHVFGGLGKYFSILRKRGKLVTSRYYKVVPPPAYLCEGIALTASRSSVIHRWRSRSEFVIR